jgi:hypothetical protein
MKAGIVMAVVFGLAMSVAGQVRSERRSLLEDEPGVVYLARTIKKPIELLVIKEAPVFSDREGRNRLGFLRADQKVRLEAMTDKVYRVRGEGLRNGIVGWVAPWAFASKDPEFVGNLKKLYERQIEVEAVIAEGGVAIGMTIDEVALSRGKPTKTNLRRTEKGQSGKWEYIDYEELKHYITRIDPVTGAAYRQFSHVTLVERGKTVIEFEDEVVTAVEESEDRQGGNVRIIVPPVVFGW